MPSGPGQALSQGLLPRGRGPAVEEGRGRLGPSLPAPRGPAGAAIGHGARARTLPWRPRAAGCSSQRTGSSQQEGTEKAQTQSPQSPSVWTSQSPHRPVVAPFLVPRPRGGGRLCSQTLPPGIRDSGKHFPLLFSSEGGHARNSASQRPAWAPPQPAALTVASRAILVVRPPQVAGCCSSGLERGAAAGDPAPAHPPRGNQALG